MNSRHVLSPWKQPLGEPFSEEECAELIAVIADFIHQTNSDSLSLKVFFPKNRFQKKSGMQYRFKPEVIFQLKGSTIFELPNERMVLNPGEVGIIPTGVPHGETAKSEKLGYRALVVGFYSKTVSMHFAKALESGKAGIQSMGLYATQELDSLVNILNTIIGNAKIIGPASTEVQKGLTLALFALFYNLIKQSGIELGEDHGKVFQAKWLIREQISNPKLNVKRIARKLRCSPDYLSHLFNRETGENLIHYIHRQRIQGATVALKTTPLSIAEIALASGFNDPAYFTRVFKKFTSLSPQNYRLEMNLPSENNRPGILDDLLKGTTRREEAGF